MEQHLIVKDWQTRYQREARVKRETNSMQSREVRLLARCQQEHQHEKSTLSRNHRALYVHSTVHAYMYLY